ncbi:MAG: hypothetical protein GWP61_10755 [Chloroflexi bacterium]|jgi:hypothetical protein|nr:hypothetical protein [Chloroflexota bacterium]
MLIEVLRERNLLRVSVALVVLLVVGAMARQWIMRRPSGGEIGVALGVTAVYLLAWIRIPITKERTHLIEHGTICQFNFCHFNFISAVFSPLKANAPSVIDSNTVFRF